MLIVGAGLSQGLGVAGVDALTTAARQIPYPMTNLGPARGSIGVPLANLLWKALAAYYDAPNFETMLHAVEALVAFKGAPTGAQIPDVLRPVTNMFMDITPRWKPLADSDQLEQLASNIICAVAERIAADARSAVRHFSYDACRTLVNRLLSEFDVTIIDLNYDDILETIIADFEDGFEKCNGGQFRWTLFAEDNGLPRLLHVHGSIRFGISTKDNRPPEIVRFDDAEQAKPHWSYIIDVTAQSGDRIFLGPIITGLRKADKTLWAPYGHYMHHFVEALFHAERVLSIGYGGNDAHLNQWLLHWFYMHEGSAKYAAITKFDEITSLPDDARVLILPGALGGFSSIRELKAYAASHLTEYKDRVFTHQGAMIDGTGLPDAVRLEALLSFLK